MSDQVIISISREYGSGGHDIAVMLAERLDMKLYDKNILDEIAQSMGVVSEEAGSWENVEEKTGSRLFHRRVGAFSSNTAELLADLQFDFIKKKADQGESFIIVGRCADIILDGMDCLVKIFVSGELEMKTGRIMRRRNIDHDAAQTEMQRIDKMRRKYHNTHGNSKWGDSRHYDLCINSFIGIPETVDVLEYYIKKHFKNITAETPEEE